MKPYLDGQTQQGLFSKIYHIQLAVWSHGGIPFLLQYFCGFEGSGKQAEHSGVIML